MFRSLTFSLIALAIATQTHRIAQADDAPPMRTLDLKVARYRVASEPYPYDSPMTFEGVREVFVAPQGKVFLTVRIAAVPQQQGAEGTIDQNDVLLTIDGVQYKTMGELRPDGVAGLIGNLYIPIEADLERPIRLDPTYLIPEDAKSGTISFAGEERKLDLDVPIVSRAKATDAMKVVIGKVGLFDELPLKYPDRNTPYLRSYAPTNGKLLIVEFAVKPLAHNDYRGLFIGRDPAFGLTLDDGTYLAPFASFDEGVTLLKYVYVKPDAAGEFPAQAVAWIFVVPEGTRSAELCFYADPVAEVKIPARTTPAPQGRRR